MKKESKGLVDLRKCIKGEPKNKIIEFLVNQAVPAESFERISNFLKILNKTKVNMVLLKSLAFAGVPTECTGLRGVVWRLLFGQLPVEPQKWESFLQLRQSQYDSFRKDLVIIPRLPHVKPDHSCESTIEVQDHPLSLSSESRWCLFYKDDNARKQINKDMRRTRRDVALFKEMVGSTEEEKDKSESIFIPSNAQITGIDNDEDEPSALDCETHKHVMARILLIYAKLNQGVGYVQGMNELLAVIYYCFHQYSPPALYRYLESDSFFCFNNLMGEVRDEYLRDLDTEDSGIKGKIRMISDMLQRIDREYWAYFKNNRVDLEMFALRWVMLFLAQDLSLEDVIRFWDTIMSDNEKYNFFNYVILQLVLDARKDVMSSEPHLIAKRLQEMPQGPAIIDLLVRAEKLVAADQDKEEYLVKQYLD